MAVVAVGFIVLLGVAGFLVVGYYKAVLRRNRALFQKETERLHREGNTVIAEPKLEVSPMPDEKFGNDLMGHPVANPAHGIYIKVGNGKAAKIML